MYKTVLTSLAQARTTGEQGLTCGVWLANATAFAKEARTVLATKLKEK